MQSFDYVHSKKRCYVCRRNLPLWMYTPNYYGIRIAKCDECRERWSPLRRKKRAHK